MVTFDFATAGASVSATGSGATLSNTADGVTFTLSGDAIGGPEFLFFGNSGLVGTPLYFDNFVTGNTNNDNDAITLTWASTANASNTRISGNATNPIELNWGFVAGSWNVQYQTAGGGTFALGTITNNADTGSFTIQHTAVTGIVFTSTSGPSTAGIVLNSITANQLNCFTAGTRIATPDGPRDVETLQPGDMVLTASGAAQPISWLGHTYVDTRLMHPAKVNPICITAGALGGGLPERDLLLSADHAIEIDGALYNAGALINGATIYQVAKMPMPGFTYYHIETEAHELLLAEGVAAESFIDYGGRNSFENAGDAEDRHIPEMDLPRVSSARLVPEEIRNRLAPVAAAA